MKVNQIYQLINSINNQMWGKSAITTNDLSGIISLGKTLSLNEDDADAYLGILVDRIGKTVIRTLDLELEFPNFFMDSFEFGGILQKINIQPFASQQNSDWLVGADGFTPTVTDIAKPSNISVTYFKGADTWSYKVSIPSHIFFTAFTSMEAMNSFIDGIMNALTDNMVMAINNMSRTALCNLIAEKVKNENGVVNLLKLYNEGTTNDLDVNGALRSKEFLRFSTMVIRNYINYMKEPSALYNVGGMVRTTARDNMHVIALTDYASAVKSYLLSDSYWKEFVELPLYTEVNHWQGSGTAVGFNNNSKVSIIPSSEDGEDNPTTYTQNGVVMVLADRQSIAIGINKRRVGKFVNDIDDVVTTKTSATIQYINDTSENAVIFVIDSYDEDEITLDKSTLTFANSSADTQTITATVPSGQTVTWSTSKSSVATVSGGVVTPVGAGTCTIKGTVTVDGVKYNATCSVTVGS